jgi:Transport and Golgi organisation 2
MQAKSGIFIPRQTGCRLMCTVSFIPNPRGFFVGMNRDESVRRPVALLPQVHFCDGRLSVYPSEPAGGTWIGLNDAGLCFALINWYAVRVRPVNGTISRGTVVKALLPARTLDESHSALRLLPLSRMPPFRVMAIALRDRSITEFRWDQDLLLTERKPWNANHWFSSGLDESAAQAKRGEVCRQEWKKPNAGDLEWLRELHKSHLPEPGAFSICMHREEAATVSYTEIEIKESLGVMRYHPGPLCGGSADLIERTIPLPR